MHPLHSWVRCNIQIHAIAQISLEYVNSFFTCSDHTTVSAGLDSTLLCVKDSAILVEYSSHGASTNTPGHVSQEFGVGITACAVQGKHTSSNLAGCGRCGLACCQIIECVGEAECDVRADVPVSVAVVNGCTEILANLALLFFHRRIAVIPQGGVSPVIVMFRERFFR